MAARLHTRQGKIHRTFGTQLPVEMRDYQAAMVNNLTASWLGVNDTAAQVVYKNLVMLRGRSREQIQNNDYARFFMTLLKTNVVGPQGFNFQARPLDRPGVVDKTAATAIDTAFIDWTKKRHCDLLGQSSLPELERQFISNVAADGEILCRMYTGRKYGKYGFKIKFIDPGYLDVNYNDSTRGGNRIEMSIEYDADDVPVAYHIIKPDPNVSTVAVGYSQTGRRERVPASEILHCFIADRVGQPRGLPWMGTALLRMNMQGGFEEAALVNARAGAGKMGFFENAGGTELEQIFAEGGDGEIIDESDPGTWHGLPPGVKIADYDPTYPNNEFGPFTKSILRGIAAGLGVAYHTLANDLEGVNYSSGRLGSQNERDVWTLIQDWMKDVFLFPIYEAWMGQQLVMGSTITLPSGGSLRASDEEKYQNAEFQGRRWAGVDPKKESDANQIDYNMRTKSLSQIIRDKAQDPDKVWQEIAEDKAKLEALGIEIAPPPAAGGNPDDSSGDKPDEPSDSGEDE